jgi:hypothetical protein
LEESLVISIQENRMVAFNEVGEMLFVNNPQITRSSIYRIFCKNHVNRIPHEEREKAKKFNLAIFLVEIYLAYLCLLLSTEPQESLFYRVYEAKNAENLGIEVKNWFEMKPEIYKQNSSAFKAHSKSRFLKQACET